MADHLTPTVMGIINNVRQTQDYSLLPYLADALQDADYADDEVLKKLRAGGGEADAVRLLCGVLGGEYAESLKWLDDLVEELGPGGYEDNQPMDFRLLMSAADEVQGTWGHAHTELDGTHWQDTLYDRLDEFWKHWEVVTGRKPEFDSDYGPSNPFSCSC